MKNFTRVAAALAISLLLIGCGPPSSADVIRKSELIQNKGELEKALGKPSEISKIGPLETWTYETSDGSVSFLITGDRVQLAAGGSQPRK